MELTPLATRSQRAPHRPVLGGAWTASGLSWLGSGGRRGVARAMLHRMLAQLADPVTGQPLGRLPSLGAKAPVGAFDLTFSPPKSVSVMWAMADRPPRPPLRSSWPERPRRSWAWAEDHVFRTRTGAQGARQEPVRGVVASAWLHYESREGDPQLHHHLVVLNRAQAVSDGAWRTLDSKALYPWVVALSERHVGMVEDLMTARFGVAWADMPAIAGRVAKREIDGVAPDLVAEFSRRTMAIEEAIAQKAADLEADRDRPLTSPELGVVHRSAWRETRPKKLHRPVSEMTAEWVGRAQPWVGKEPTSWVASLAGRSDLPALRSDDLTDAMLTDLAQAALAARSERSSVFTQANVYADVERQLHGVLFLGRGPRSLTAPSPWPSAWSSSCHRLSWPTCQSVSVPPMRQASSPRPAPGSTRRRSCWRPKLACSTPAGTPPGRLSATGPSPGYVDAP